MNKLKSWYLDVTATKVGSDFDSVYVADILFDYSGNYYLLVAQNNVTPDQTKYQIWNSSMSILATIDTMTPHNEFTTNNWFSGTSYYTMTNVGSAISNGVYLPQTLQDGIPSYKLLNYNAMIK